MKSWYILFTNYENSLATMRKLVKSHLPKGCGAYIPVTISGNKFHKTRIYNKPMYPFYIFICCTDESQLKVLRSKMSKNNIVGYFLQNSDGTYAKLSSDQIRSLETNYRLPTKNTVDSPYELGDEVHVEMGPMKGISGLITSITGEYVFISMCTNKGKYIDLPVLVSDLKQPNVASDQGDVK